VRKTNEKKYRTNTGNTGHFHVFTGFTGQPKKYRTLQENTGPLGSLLNLTINNPKILGLTLDTKLTFNDQGT